MPRLRGGEDVRMKAVGKEVIVRMAKPKPMAPGGIYLPPDAREEKPVGQVMAIGPLVPEAWEVAVGDWVMLPEGGKRYSGPDWCPEDPEREHWVGNWREIMGILEVPANGA